MFINNIEFKTFVITGFNSGIGKNLTKNLLKFNCNVILLGRKNFFFKKKNNTFFFKCNLEKSSQIEKSIKKIKNIFLSIDGFVHCAAVNQIKTIENITFSDWDRVLSVNLKAPFLISKLLKKNFEKSTNASIVFISSIAGHRKSLVSGVHYVASKSGLIGLAKQLSHEYGKKNIRVNCITPSQTLTPMLIKSMNSKQFKNLEKNIPLGRLAKTQEQVNVILFLLSNYSSYIHGTSINVDGGQI